MKAERKTNHTKPYDSDDARWAAVVNRDHNANDYFYFSVLTTGIYCRPGCPARTPQRENVRFHASCADAEQAGFRACKRCKPDIDGLAAQHATIVARACRMIESADETSTLEALAADGGMSRFHFHRIFKSVTGVTPKAYAAAHRAAKVRQVLPRTATVTEAIYAAGYNGSGQFYVKSGEVLGMTPRAYRDGGDKETIRFALGQCSLGSILVAATGKGICAILMDDDPEALLGDLQDRFPKAQLIGADKSFEQWVAQVIGLVEAPTIGLDLPLDVRGTAFQQRVWQALREIPPGAVVSYSQVADRIGAGKQSVRAVATAIAANPVAVAIPCHRVVRSNGDLAGYRWGIERKQTLLLREQSRD